MHIISEPRTFIKIIRNTIKIVQIIRPRIVQNQSLIASFHTLLGQVDLSCCGVSYSTHNEIIYETCPHAIEHCQKKQFEVLKDNMMHQPNRIEDRVYKLSQRGWTRIINGLQLDGLQVN